MSNLSNGTASKSQPPPSEEYWGGACVIQLDYNVLFFSGGSTAYLSLRNETVLLNKSIKKLK